MQDTTSPDTRGPNTTGTHGEKIVSTARARAGVTGHNVRYVLAFGLIAVVIVFALAYFGVLGT